MPRLTPAQLDVAREQARAILGPARLARLEEAGLIVVRHADVLPRERETRMLTDVRLDVPEPFARPLAVTVRTDGEVIAATATDEAEAAVREAEKLAEVLGRVVNIEIDSDGVIVRAWTEDRQ